MKLDLRRPTLIASVIALHLACYWAVTRVTAVRDSVALFDTTTAIDRLIPHLPATWPLYWLAYPFIVLGGGFALARLDTPSFHRAISAVAAMTVAGAAVQLVFPARAPWPAVPAPMQQRFHDSALVLPYATLPSMHVAYCAVAAGLLAAVRPGRAVRIVGAVVVAAVALSTLTLKEHVILDALTGLLLAWGTLRWWRREAA
jgi:membrane-associated phospholipid phosphatase